MKKLLVLLMILLSMPVCAQITFEKSYYNKNYVISLLQVDSNEYLYAYYNQLDTLALYNLDHSLNRAIFIPGVEIGEKYLIQNVTRKLFDIDDKIEFIIEVAVGYGGMRILNEDGLLLYGCDSCGFHNEANRIGTDPIGTSAQSIVNTSNGTKMMIFKYPTFSTEVYSLPGKLPTCATKLSVTDAPTIISNGGSLLSAYPNPSNGKIRVAYTLPEGVTSGELVITTVDGIEIKRYRVGNMFNDILIEKSELQSGAYFYKLITERGESQARKFVIMN